MSDAPSPMINEAKLLAGLANCLMAKTTMHQNLSGELAFVDGGWNTKPGQQSFVAERWAAGRIMRWMTPSKVGHNGWSWNRVDRQPSLFCIGVDE